MSKIIILFTLSKTQRMFWLGVVVRVSRALSVSLICFTISSSSTTRPRPPLPTQPCR